jgi:Tim44-like domain
MLSYFSEQLAGKASRGLINRITDVKLLQGDLAEAWREGDTDYVTVAMKFALKDSIVERESGRTVEAFAAWPAAPRQSVAAASRADKGPASECRVALQHRAGGRLSRIRLLPVGRWFESGPGSQHFQ